MSDLVVIAAYLKTLKKIKTLFFQEQLIYAGLKTVIF